MPKEVKQHNHSCSIHTGEEDVHATIHHMTHPIGLYHAVCHQCHDKEAESGSKHPPEALTPSASKSLPSPPSKVWEEEKTAEDRI